MQNVLLITNVLERQWRDTSIDLIPEAVSLFENVMQSARK